jgi:hypothetical protein
MRSTTPAIVLALGLAAGLARAAAPPLLDVHYELDTEIGADLTAVRGEGRIRVRNRSAHPLAELVVSTYPDQYREADPDLTWNERDLRYPRGWAPGATELTLGGATLSPLTATAWRALLDEPLPPGAERALPLSFHTLVPRKRGPFGHLDGVLTLQGGWHPTLLAAADGPPLPATYELRLVRPEGLRGLDTGEALGRLGAGGERALLPAFSLSLSRRFRPIEVGTLGHPFFSLHGAGGESRRVGETLDEGLSHYRSVLGRPGAPPMPVVHAYLDQRLAAPAVGYLLVSDQIFRAMSLLGVFHVRGLLDAQFEALLLRDFPELRSEPWTAQFLAYALRQGYFAEKYGLGRSLGDLIRGPLRLLPAFDELITGADFPGRQFYLHRIELENERVEDYFSHNRPFPTGALIAERLGRLVGEEAVVRLGAGFLRLPEPRPGLAEHLVQSAGQELGWFFEQWLGPARPMGFRIAEVRKARTGAGWRTEVDVERTGTRIELLDVRASLAGAEPHRGSLLLDRPLVTYVFESTAEPGRITLDPDKQIEEQWLADNVRPARLKLLLYNSRVNLEPKTRELDALALLAFLREHDYRTLVFAELFTKPLRTGASFDLARHFGQPVDPLRYPLQLRAGAGFERTSADPETGEAAQSILTLRAGFQYDTTNYLSEVDQKNDTFVDLLFEAAPGGPIGGPSFLQARLAAARYQRLSSRLTAAGRLMAGVSFGALPSNRRIDLGNANMLRGFVSNEVLADDVLLGSFELRTDVLRNFDFGFPWGLAFLHRLQLVTFVDAALASPQRDFFADPKLAADAGVGLRLHGRWFGIMPSMGKIDLGFPLQGAQGGGMRIYLGLTQAF